MPQQSVAAAWRVTNAKPGDRVFVQAAVLEIRARRFAFERPFELLDEERLRLAVHFDEGGALLIFFALLAGAFFGPGNGDSAFFRDEPHRFGKLALFHFHDEVVDVAAFAAAETVEDLFDRRNGERWSFFLMKGTEPAEILARFFQADVFAHHADDVRLLFHFFGNRSRFRHVYRNSKFGDSVLG